MNRRRGAFLSAALVDATTDAEARSACKAVYDDCRASTPTTPCFFLPCVRPTPLGTSECARRDASCTATVAELETCVNDIPKSKEALLDVLVTCESLTLADLPSDEMLPEPEMPASCQMLNAKCPQ